MVSCWHGGLSCNVSWESLPCATYSFDTYKSMQCINKHKHHKVIKNQHKVECHPIWFVQRCECKWRFSSHIVSSTFDSTIISFSHWEIFSQSNNSSIMFESPCPWLVVKVDLSMQNVSINLLAAPTLCSPHVLQHMLILCYRWSWAAISRGLWTKSPSVSSVVSHHHLWIALCVAWQQ